MSQDIPRRLKFKKNTQQSDQLTAEQNQPWVSQHEKTLPENYKKFVEKQSTELALKHMQEFREKHDRFPDRHELEEIAENIYSQIKEEQDRQAHAHAPQSHDREHKAHGDAHKGHGRFRETSNQNTTQQNSRQKKPRHQRTLLEERKKRREKIMEKKKKEETEKPQEKKGHGRKEKDDASALSENDDLEQDDFSVQPEKELSVADLLSETPSKKGDKKKGSKKEETDEEEILEEDEESLVPSFEDSEEKDEGDLEFFDKEETETDKCPNCGIKTSNIFFCPKCGKSFCSSCTKKAQKTQEGLQVTCPKCANSFKTRQNF